MKATITKTSMANSGLQTQFSYNTIDNYSVWTPKELLGIRAAWSTVHLPKEIEQYIRNIIVSVRTERHVQGGPSPRATIAYNNAVKCVAVFSGFKYVVPFHVTSIGHLVLSHRFQLNTKENVPTSSVISFILENEIPPF